MMMPDYPDDLASQIGSDLTNDDFIIFYMQYNDDLTVDAEGKLTAAPDAAQRTTIFWIVYTPKVAGVGVKTQFSCWVQVHAPMKAFIPSKDNITMTMPDMDDFTVSPDGFLQAGSSSADWFTAELPDGRRLRTYIRTAKIPSWLRHPVMVCRENDTDVPLQWVETDVGSLNDSYFDVTVADPSIVSYSSSNGAFTPHKRGTTTVTLKHNQYDVQTSFTFTVVAYDSTICLGTTNVDLPAGYYTELPALQDDNGKELVMTWEITHQSSEDAFRMEGNKIYCLKAGEREAQTSLSCGVIGKHAVYFEFLGPKERKRNLIGSPLTVIEFHPLA